MRITDIGAPEQNRAAVLPIDLPGESNIEDEATGETDFQEAMGEDGEIEMVDTGMMTESGT